jgi:aldose 1-epimerase
VPPSGEQVELVHGGQRVWVVEVGGALRAYQIGGRDVLDGYAADERCTGGRGQMLIPWPNRVRDGQYEFDGQEEQLPLAEPPKRNAIHGLVRWVNWTVEERGTDSATMTYLLHPQEGYPHALELAIQYRLGPDGLRVETTATNAGARPAPFGSGSHPYLTAGTPTIDAVTLLSPAATRLLADEQQIPIGREAVDGGPFDFRRARELGDMQLDTGYTDLERDDDGLARVRLSAPGGAWAELWMDESYPFLMLFSGDTLAPERRRRGLGVEPMTCAPNAFQSGDGLLTLEPGGSVRSRFGIRAGG